MQQLNEVEKRDKSYTCKQEEKLYKNLSLHWIFNLFSIKELYLITCYISLYWVGLISRGADYPVRLRCNAYVETPRVVGSTRRLYD